MIKERKQIPVICLSCQHEFPRDPRFEVDCPTCQAKAGQFCKRPSGHQGPFNDFHSERDLAALAGGYYDHQGNEKCGPNSDSERAKEIFRKHNFKIPSGLIKKSELSSRPS